ncbi:hypothetical protein EAF04_009576 [Stromatinia cepivora]|nr:hypothetical protein EAF04_009576 [Stromatinia cepivora]
MPPQIIKTRPKRPCPNCSRKVSNPNEHLKSCLKQKQRCELCDKQYPAGRYRDHKPVCEGPKISTPKPLSEYLDLGWFNWRYKCPTTLPDLTSINFINDKTKDLWNTLPVKIDMHSNSIPTEEEMYSKVFLSINESTDFNAYENGNELFDNPNKIRIAGTALFKATTQSKTQNLAKNNEICGSISNIYVKNVPLEPPEFLRTQYHHFGTATKLRVNISPTGTFTDLWIDMERSVFSLAFGRSRKIWLFFPPTERNMRLFSKVVGESNILARIGSDLEGGVVCETTTSSALYLPAGTLCTVFTIEGGLLGEIKFTTAADTAIMDRFIQAEMISAFPRSLTSSDYNSLKYIQEAKYWPSLVSDELVGTLTSFENVIDKGRHPLWTALPEVSQEMTQSEAQLTMHLTRALMSKNIQNVYVNRSSSQGHAEDNQSALSAQEKRNWAEMCIGQLGRQDVMLPVYKIVQCDLPDADFVPPLLNWTKKNPSLYIQPEIGTSVMVTPSGAYSDIHIDSTTIGRAVCIERCTKIWLVWPPTKRNLQLWADNKGLGVAIQTYGHKLEGGFVIQISGNRSQANALTIPAGTLHCVFTIFGGFLTGSNYSTAEDIPLAVEMLRMQVIRGQYEDQIEKDCSWLTKTIERVIQAQPIHAPRALSLVAQLLQHIENHGRSQNREWGKFIKSAASLFKEYRRGLNVRKVCSCNEVVPEKIDLMIYHFRNVDHCI